MENRTSVLNSEMIARVVCVVIVLSWVIALVAYLGVKYGGVDPVTNQAPLPWGAILFVPASLAYLTIGLIMVVCRLMFVTLAIAIYYLAVSTIRIVRGERTVLTAVLALLAAAGHVIYVLYP